jgi:hypothetical protein
LFDKKAFLLSFMDLHFVVLLVVIVVVQPSHPFIVLTVDLSNIGNFASLSLTFRKPG